MCMQPKLSRLQPSTSVGQKLGHATVLDSILVRHHLVEPHRSAFAASCFIALSREQPAGPRHCMFDGEAADNPDGAG